jgi:hypothetical protein
MPRRRPTVVCVNGLAWPWEPSTLMTVPSAAIFFSSAIQRLYTTV